MAIDEVGDKQHEEHKEQNLGDASGGPREAAEPERRGQEGDGQEDQSPIQHGKVSCRWEMVAEEPKPTMTHTLATSVPSTRSGAKCPNWNVSSGSQ